METKGNMKSQYNVFEENFDAMGMYNQVSVTQKRTSKASYFSTGKVCQYE